MLILVMEDETLSLAFWEKGCAPCIRRISMITTELKVAISLELTSDEKYVVLGGCDR